MTDNPQLLLANNFVQYTNRNVFLTGKAGTGKTTFLRRMKEESPKRMVVVAPTGVAAINAGGVTIHSMFQLPFGPIVPGTVMSESGNRRFSKEKIDIIRSMDLLVIDEISMVRADLLDGIDSVLRMYRNKLLPFGGVQLLMIGDLQQLAPVIKDEEWNLLKTHYATQFFFSSKALEQTPLVNIELKHIYRQNDEAFIDILNKIRNQQIDGDTLTRLNQRYIPGFSPKTEDGYIILTTHNHSAKRINDQHLEQLAARPHHFKATIEGDFPEYSHPTDADLMLKLGAQVMFVKNDLSPEKRYYNGKIGTIQQINGDTIHVKCANETLIEVTPQEWRNIKYSIDDNTQEIVETETGKFIQYPLKTAWAITIHKSQGLTFEKAIIDAGQSFAHGQVYVALSRCKTLEGMVLSSPITASSFRDDNSVQTFSRHVETHQPDEQQFDDAKINYQHTLLFELFNLAPLSSRLNYLHRQTGEHAAALHGTLTPAIDAMLLTFRNEVMPVAEKFMSQIKQYTAIVPDIEKNEPLQGRIAKAAPWFTEKMESIMAEPLKGVAVVSDNKTIKKQVTDALIRFKEELHIKIACFNACAKGFDMKTYLDTRAKAILVKHEAAAAAVKKSASDEAASLTINHPVLYARLKQWRNQKAEENNYPVYVILPTATMAELCNKLPLYMPELSAIKGLGKKKIAEYGPEIMAMIMTYRKENNIKTAEIVPINFDEAKSAKQPAIHTRQVSLNLFREGMTIDQIAEQRGFVRSTIENHLSHFIEKGELSLDGLMDKHQIDTITDYIATHQIMGISEIKDALGDAVSYGNIRMVISYLKQQSKNE